jgi:hypothetical protein
VKSRSNLPVQKTFPDMWSFNNARTELWEPFHRYLAMSLAAASPPLHFDRIVIDVWNPKKRLRILGANILSRSKSSGFAQTAFLVRPTCVNRG